MAKSSKGDDAKLKGLSNASQLPKPRSDRFVVFNTRRNHDQKTKEKNYDVCWDIFCNRHRGCRNHASHIWFLKKASFDAFFYWFLLLFYNIWKSSRFFDRI